MYLKHIQQMAAVADWILFESATNDQWNDFEIELFENMLDERGRDWLTPITEHCLHLALQFNHILKQNEAISSNKNDAKALAHAFDILIKANTNNGVVNEDQLAEDIIYFAVDQDSHTLSGLLRIAKPSNAAYNLLAGPRLGTTGWNKNIGIKVSNIIKMANLLTKHITLHFSS